MQPPAAYPIPAIGSSYWIQPLDSLYTLPVAGDGVECGELKGVEDLKGFECGDPKRDS